MKIPPGMVSGDEFICAKCNSDELICKKCNSNEFNKIFNAELTENIVFDDIVSVEVTSEKLLRKAELKLQDYSRKGKLYYGTDEFKKFVKSLAQLPISVIPGGGTATMLISINNDFIEFIGKCSVINKKDD